MNKHPKSISQPNEAYAHSNLGYVILGQLIEKVSGRSYESFIHDNIISKLSLSPADIGFEILDNSRHATGYQEKLSFLNLTLGFMIDKDKFMDEPHGKWRPFKQFYVNDPAYGGLIGKPIAFVRFIQDILKTNSRLISEEFKLVYFLENRNLHRGHTGMCASWFEGRLHRHRYFTHAGFGEGYYCEIRIYPDIDLGSVIFMNHTGTEDERMLDDLDSESVLQRRHAVK